jgi:hypothetical protein
MGNRLAGLERATRRRTVICRQAGAPNDAGLSADPASIRRSTVAGRATKSRTVWPAARSLDSRNSRSSSAANTAAHYFAVYGV